LHDSEFRENLARRNLANGFFFCARVERVIIRGNQFIANGRSGVGNLGQDGDTLNLVEGNLCEANGMCGIELLDGVANTVKDNTCRNNSQGAPGRWSGISLSTTARSIVAGNSCVDTQPVKTQKHGIEERADCRENVFSGNAASGNQQSDLVLEGRDIPPDTKNR
jgi:parallel beta-helix repeat protein